eukprot:TRINITY_DN3985_c0_g2_i5.p1 TRINITY_DN3985_c0_g2~~TRINITY_DN3985_c0_g2_i5.p1  ORF type:complete len:1398 (-),score=331.43 TRINITY_DN3985_c0_g2_i5:397-4590(-)
MSAAAVFATYVIMQVYEDYEFVSYAYLSVLPVLFYSFTNAGNAIQTLERIERSYKSDLSPETHEIIGKAFQEIGLYTTLTYLAVLGAFLAGLSSGFEFIRDISIQSSVLVTILYLSQMILLPILLTFEVNRVQSGRVDLLFCLRVPDQQPLQKQSVFSSFMGNNYAKALSNPFLQTIVLAFFLGFLGYSIYVLSTVESGIEPLEVLGDSSGYVKFVNSDASHFQSRGQSSHVLLRGIDYKSTKDKQFIKDLELRLSKSKDIVVNSVNFWYTPFVNWLIFTSQCRYPCESDAAINNNWIPLLESFLQSSSGQEYATDIVFTASKSQIEATRLRMFSTYKKQAGSGSTQRQRIMDLVEDLNHLHNVNVRASFVGTSYSLYDQYDAFPWDLTRALLIATCISSAPYLLVFVGFMTNAILLFITGASCIMVVAAANNWGAGIDQITFWCFMFTPIFCRISGGLVGYPFATLNGLTREENLRKSLTVSGPPLILSFLCAGIALVGMVFFDGSLFGITRKVLSVEIVILFFNCIVVTPCLLLLLGSEPYDDNIREDGVELQVISIDGQKKEAQPEKTGDAEPKSPTLDDMKLGEKVDGKDANIADKGIDSKSAGDDNTKDKDSSNQKDKQDGDDDEYDEVEEDEEGEEDDEHKDDDDENKHESGPKDMTKTEVQEAQTKDQTQLKDKGQQNQAQSKAQSKAPENASEKAAPSLFSKIGSFMKKKPEESKQAEPISVAKPTNQVEQKIETSAATGEPIAKQTAPAQATIQNEAGNQEKDGTNENGKMETSVDVPSTKVPEKAEPLESGSHQPKPSKPENQPKVSIPPLKKLPQSGISDTKSSGAEQSQVETRPKSTSTSKPGSMFQKFKDSISGTQNSTTKKTANTEDAPPQDQKQTEQTESKSKNAIDVKDKETTKTEVISAEESAKQVPVEKEMNPPTSSNPAGPTVVGEKDAKVDKPQENLPPNVDSKKDAEESKKVNLSTPATISQQSPETIHSAPKEKAPSSAKPVDGNMNLAPATTLKPATSTSIAPATKTATKAATSTLPSTSTSTLPSTSTSTLPSTSNSTLPSTSNSTLPSTSNSTTSTTAPTTKPSTSATTISAPITSTLTTTKPATESVTESKIETGSGSGLASISIKNPTSSKPPLPTLSSLSKKSDTPESAPQQATTATSFVVGGTTKPQPLLTPEQRAALAKAKEEEQEEPRKSFLDDDEDDDDGPQKKTPSAAPVASNVASFVVGGTTKPQPLLTPEQRAALAKAKAQEEEEEEPRKSFLDVDDEDDDDGLQKKTPPAAPVASNVTSFVVGGTTKPQPLLTPEQRAALAKAKEEEQEEPRKSFLDDEFDDGDSGNDESQVESFATIAGGAKPKPIFTAEERAKISQMQVDEDEEPRESFLDDDDIEKYT